MYIREHIPKLNVPNNIHLNETIMLFLKINKKRSRGCRSNNGLCDCTFSFNSVVRNSFAPQKKPIITPNG